MTKVRLESKNGVGIVTIDNPPVNSLSVDVRAGLIDALAKANAAPDVRAIVIASEGSSFIAGADISEFDGPRLEPTLPQVMDALDASEKPVVAAIRGVALGGGLEIALACSGRVATAGSKIGLPEVKLGLLPGAGGTQRLPRLIGAAKALAIISSGDPMPALKALELGIVDQVVDNEALPAAIELALKSERRRVSDLRLPERDRAEFEEASRAILSKHKGEPEIEAIVACVQAAFEPNFADGVAFEDSQFDLLLRSDRSKALRYAFFAERASAKVVGLSADTNERPIKSVAIIGGGTMGSGIAMTLLNVGVETTIVETDSDAAARAAQRVSSTYDFSLRRGSLTEAQKAERMAKLRVISGLKFVADADLVIEAAFEDMAVKREIFSKISEFAKPGAILATNTSFLNVDQIAAATSRQSDVVGMHFFSPANVMKLVEVVRGAATAPDALKTVVNLARKIGKTPVTVGVCHGFVGNRMLERRAEQVDRLLLEGASPEEVDAALTNFGFRMGPCAMCDLAGIDITWRMRQSIGAKAPVEDAIYDAGRLGQKNGRGYYLYPEGARSGVSDPEVAALLDRVSAENGITRRAIPEDEILKRLVYPMVNEGAKILSEGIAARASDIDVIWLHGYNWPRWRGGPMFYADQVGLQNIVDDLNRISDASGDETTRPAPLLQELAAAGRTFQSL